MRAAHPLVSAAAYAALPAAARRALHQRLAAGADDPLERARHAALAAVSTDPRVAAALDAGVAAALAAGAPDIAVELSRLACSTPSADADRAARLDLLADALVRAGDSPGAVAAQRQAIALTRPGRSGPAADPARRDGDGSDRLGRARSLSSRSRWPKQPPTRSSGQRPC